MKCILNALAEEQGRKKIGKQYCGSAEGEEFGGTEIAKIITERMPDQEVRLCILGHIQRGGAPTCFDRLIASRMGYSAVECFMEERFNVFVGIVNNQMHYIPLDEAVKETKYKRRLDENCKDIIQLNSFMPAS